MSPEKSLTASRLRSPENTTSSCDSDMGHLRRAFDLGVDISMQALSGTIGLRTRQAIEAGCDDYDTKPVELPRLLEKIRTRLGLPE